MIAFYFPPYSGVGAKRISYWFDRLSSDGHDVKVLTATQQPIPKNSVKYVDAFQNGKYLRRRGSDNSFLWIPGLVTALREEKRTRKPDVVLFTVGPFFCALALLFVKFPEARVVIDFRDPWAMNPLTRSSRFVLWVKKVAEALAISCADLVIVTSKQCEFLLGKKPKKTAIIENGYDERSVPSARSSGIGDGLLYIGKLSSRRSLEPLVNALKKTDNSAWALSYIGPNVEEAVIQGLSPSYITKELSYASVMKRVDKSWIGLVLASGEPLESTTKIFDYICLRKPVLVVHETVTFDEGAIVEMALDYPGIFFSSTDSEQIMSVLGEIWEKRISISAELNLLDERTIKKYSRGYGYKALLKNIFE